MISYLPTLYGAFSQRELNISLLDARAGSPPTAAELLRRHAQFSDNEVLTPYLRDWEIWAAQLMESHLSYPVLCYFRSQHDNQSWLAAFTAVLDVSRAADRLWRGSGQMAIATHVRHCAARGRGSGGSPASPADCGPQRTGCRRRTPRRSAILLVECRASTKCGEAGDKKLHELREMYEPYLNGLSLRLLMPLPIVGSGRAIPWKTGSDRRGEKSLPAPEMLEVRAMIPAISEIRGRWTRGTAKSIAIVWNQNSKKTPAPAGVTVSRIEQFGSA